MGYLGKTEQGPTPNIQDLLDGSSNERQKLGDASSRPVTESKVQGRFASLPLVSVLPGFHIVDQAGYAARNRSNRGSLRATSNRTDSCSSRWILPPIMMASFCQLRVPVSLELVARRGRGAGS